MLASTININVNISFKFIARSEWKYPLKSQWWWWTQRKSDDGHKITIDAKKIHYIFCSFILCWERSVFKQWLILPSRFNYAPFFCQSFHTKYCMCNIIEPAQKHIARNSSSSVWNCVQCINGNKLKNIFLRIHTCTCAHIRDYRTIFICDSFCRFLRAICLKFK